MKVIVPDYYKDFKCIANKCKHTCCKGWEVEIDEEGLQRFRDYPDIMEKVEFGEDVHFKLTDEEVCPFLLKNGLCDMIVKYGEDIICQTCRDHPRYRNYWNDRIEMGLGLVCEEAARLILSKETSMKLEVLSDDTNAEDLPEDEKWLIDLRDDMLDKVEGSGPLARLREYLIYRHIANALYDDRLEERIAFIDKVVKDIEKKWNKSGNDRESLIEIVRMFSYDVEYDEEVLDKYLEQTE